MKSKKLFMRFLKSSTSLFLTIMLILTCFSVLSVVYTFDASATTNKFTANSQMYLKVTSDKWGSSNAKFGAYFYYYDNEGYCYEKRSNYTVTDGEIASDYETAEYVESNVYKISVPNNGYLGYVVFVRLNPADNKIWNQSVKLNADNMGSNNCVEVNDWNNSGSWTSYTQSSGGGTDPTPSGDGYNYYVPADSSITDKVENDKLFTVNATYYDYWSDNEREQGKYLANEVNTGDLGRWWYQFDDFNAYISNYANAHTSWKFPLYFGNLYKGDEHYSMFVSHVSSLKNMTGIGDTSWSGNEYYAINNSNGMYWYNGSNNDASYKQPLQGLVGSSLDSNGNMLLSDSGSSTVSPYFDGATLSTATYNSKRVATVIKSVFPFRTEDLGNKITKYSFTSKDAKDNIYFKWNNSEPQTIKYGAGTGYGVQDKLSNFGGSSNGYGLFPFNNNSNHWNSNPGNGELDYGFGVRLDIDFRVPEKGLLPNGDHVKFNFTGDDDLWVYIGEDSNGAYSNLVLDLAGDHKEAQGEIDFATMTATAKNVFADYKSGTASVKNSDVAKSFTVGKSRATDSYLDSGKTYHMTVFYMERGESESNFSVDFTMTPVNNTLTVDKTVNVDDINSELKNSDGTTLQSICKNIDQFGYSVSSTKDSTQSVEYNYIDNSRTVNATTTAEGKFPLGDGDSAFFNGIFTASTSDTDTNNITVNELAKSVINNYTVGKNIIYINTGANNWFTKDNAAPYIKLSGEESYHAMNKLSDTIYYYALDNNTDNFKIARYVGGTTYNSKEFDWDENKNLIIVPDGDWATNSVTRQKYTGTIPSGSSGTIGSNDDEKLTYNTSWSVADKNNISSVMPSGEGRNAQFEFINGLSGDARFRNKTDLLLSYVNSVKVAPLTVSKKLYEVDGTTEVTSDDLKNETFSFKLYLDTNFDGEFSEQEIFATYNSLSVNNNVEIEGIPVGLKYRVVENSKSGYSIISGDSTGTINESGNTEEFKNKINPSSVALSINKTVDGADYSGDAFKFTQTALKDDGTGKYSLSTDAGDIQTKTSASDGEVAFDEIALNSSGTYYYAITEEYNGTPDYDYQVNNTVILAKIVYSIGDTPTVSYAVFSDDDVKEAYADMIDSFDSYISAKPTIENVTTDIMLQLTKSEGLKDTNGDGVAELVEPIEGARFELYKVDSEASTDFSNLIGYGKSDNEGKITFYSDSECTIPLGDLDVFKEGTDPSSGKKQYQIYAVKEVEAADGYALTDEVIYISADDADDVCYSTTNDCYVSSYGFINNLITIPFTGITVERSHFIIGCIVLSIGMLLGAYYIYTTRRKRLAYASRHGR